VRLMDVRTINVALINGCEVVLIQSSDAVLCLFNVSEYPVGEDLTPKGIPEQISSPTVGIFAT
jgi:hypothetical protein